MLFMYVQLHIDIMQHSGHLKGTQDLIYMDILVSSLCLTDDFV
jgi:hypothetical protein